MLPRNEFNSNKALARQLKIPVLDLELWYMAKELERRNQTKAVKRVRMRTMLVALSQLFIKPQVLVKQLNIHAYRK